MAQFPYQPLQTGRYLIVNQYTGDAIEYGGAAISPRPEDPHCPAQVWYIQRTAEHQKCSFTIRNPVSGAYLVAPSDNSANFRIKGIPNEESHLRKDSEWDINHASEGGFLFAAYLEPHQKLDLRNGHVVCSSGIGADTQIWELKRVA